MKKTKTYIDIVFPNSLRRSFTYSVPGYTDTALILGLRVVAPLRNTQRIGFIINVHKIKPDFKVKDIIEIVDTKPNFPPEMFSFLEKISNYYLAPLGKVLSAAIPPEYRMQKNRVIFVAENERPVKEFADLYEKIRKDTPVHLAKLKRHFSTQYLAKGIENLKKSGHIRESTFFQKPGDKSVFEKIVKLSADIDSHDVRGSKKKAPRQWEILENLQEAGGQLRRKELSDFSHSSLKSLQKKDYISIEQKDITFSDIWDDFHKKEKTIELNPEQKEVFEEIRTEIHKNIYKPFLIHGVTGSGKTEVYIKLIREVNATGKSAIILVPEITLTTHLASRFRGEFGDDIAIWHSNLSEAQRSKIYRSVLKGEFHMVIGARSALFLPLPNLGLIIVDEEHDQSFKQNSVEPKYHARDAALIRGVESSSVVILGSATPSLESHYNSAVSKIKKLKLLKRHSTAESPIVHLVDLKKEWKRKKSSDNPFSELLIKKIAEKLEKKEQVILLQNRRGYSNVLLCSSCGWTPSCRNCEITLTYHKNIKKLVCHYCNYQEHPPNICPKCGGNRFFYPGFGTQKVELSLKEIFPQARISRFDVDTTRVKGFSQKTMRSFENKEIDVIIGTQMIAKGLDFPNVSLVGVLNADVGLYLPDFRARERVFQLLYQVAGRVGRGEVQGEIVLQSLNPDDFTIRCAVQHNIKKFINYEYNERNPINYPPFSRLAVILFSDVQKQKAWETAVKTVNLLHKNKGTLEILGPASAPLSRIKNRYRFITIIKSRKDNDPNGGELRAHLNKFLHSREYDKLKRSARINVNIDPTELL